MRMLPRATTVAATALLMACGGGPAPEEEAAEPAEAVDAPAEPEPAADVEPEAAGDADAEADPALLDPSLATGTAPAQFRVRFETTEGPFTVEVVREWAPRGADRFYNLVEAGFFEDVAVFRVLDGFVAQFGIHGDPRVSRAWREATIPDDPVKQSNVRGTLTFATAGPNTRTTQFFINYGDNSNLDRMGFAPIGRVVEGMEVVDSFHSGYGEGANQGQAQARGNAYFRSELPELDYLESAELVE